MEVLETCRPLLFFKMHARFTTLVNCSTMETPAAGCYSMSLAVEVAVASTSFR